MGIFENAYILGSKIGEGCFASIHRCSRRCDSEKFAVKIMNKAYLNEQELIGLKNDVSILKKIRHKNVIKLVDVFDDGKKVHMVMELCDDKDLFDRIMIPPGSNSNAYLSEKQAAKITYTICRALEYLNEYILWNSTLCRSRNHCRERVYSAV